MYVIQKLRIELATGGLGVPDVNWTTHEDPVRQVASKLRKAVGDAVVHSKAEGALKPVADTVEEETWSGSKPRVFQIHKPSREIRVDENTRLMSPYRCVDDGMYFPQL